MSDFPRYHSALFREFGLMLAEAVNEIKNEAVMHLQEAADAHPERIGRINGLKLAAHIAEKLDKQITGAP